MSRPTPGGTISLGTGPGARTVSRLGFGRGQIIAEALHPCPDVVVATKGGQLRPAPGTGAPMGHPDYLSQQIEMSLHQLRTDCLDVDQPHRPDPQTPIEESVGAMATAQQATARWAAAPSPPPPDPSAPASTRSPRPRRNAHAAAHRLVAGDQPRVPADPRKSRVDRLEDNVAVARITLGDDDLSGLSSTIDG